MTKKQIQFQTIQEDSNNSVHDGQRVKHYSGISCRLY